MTKTVALVTGGAQGLGAATALGLTARGWSVGVADIGNQGACRTVSECASFAASCFPVHVDIATANGPQEMIKAAVQKMGRLDVLINCAAFAPVESFPEMTAKAWETALFVNVHAIALSMAATGEVMVRQSRGHIVNVTSAAAGMAMPDFADYAARKAAVDSITRSGAVTLAPHGIRVNSFSPGMMDTPMHATIEATFARLEGRSDVAVFEEGRTARVSTKRRTDHRKMARALVWLAVDSPDYMTAERLNVAGGLDKD